jgi:hypothetical protein
LDLRHTLSSFHSVDFVVSIADFHVYGRVDFHVDGQAYSWASYIDIIVDGQSHCWTFFIEVTSMASVRTGLHFRHRDR